MQICLDGMADYLLLLNERRKFVRIISDFLTSQTDFTLKDFYNNQIKMDINYFQDLNTLKN